MNRIRILVVTRATDPSKPAFLSIVDHLFSITGIRCANMAIRIMVYRYVQRELQFLNAGWSMAFYGLICLAMPSLPWFCKFVAVSCLSCGARRMADYAYCLLMKTMW